MHRPDEAHHGRARPEGEIASRSPSDQRYIHSSRSERHVTCPAPSTIHTPPRSSVENCEALRHLRSWHEVRRPKVSAVRRPRNVSEMCADPHIDKELSTQARQPWGQSSTRRRTTSAQSTCSLAAASCCGHLHPPVDKCQSLSFSLCRFISPLLRRAAILTDGSTRSECALLQLQETPACRCDLSRFGSTATATDDRGRHNRHHLRVLQRHRSQHQDPSPPRLALDKSVRWSDPFGIGTVQTKPCSREDRVAIQGNRRHQSERGGDPRLGRQLGALTRRACPDPVLRDATTCRNDTRAGTAPGLTQGGTNETGNQHRRGPA